MNTKHAAFFLSSIVIWALLSNALLAGETSDETSDAGFPTASRQRQWTEKNIEKVSDSALSEIIQSSNNKSTQLRAHWELLQRRLKHQDAAELEKSTELFLKVATDAIGQGGLPTWWIMAVKCEIAPSKRKKELWREVLDAHHNATKKQNDENMDIRSAIILQEMDRTNEVRFPSYTQFQLYSGFHSESLNIGAVYESWPCAYWLYCLEPDLKSVRWKSEVWAGGGKYNIQGIPAHLVDIQVSAKQIVLYGAGSCCVYIESFNLDTGKPLLRFSTGY